MKNQQSSTSFAGNLLISEETIAAALPKFRDLSRGLPEMANKFCGNNKFQCKEFRRIILSASVFEWFALYL